MATAKHPNHQKIAFLGGPGVGKSTLAQALVPKMKIAGLDVEFCPEFARAYLRRSGPLTTPYEQWVIFSGACEREDEVAIHEFIVCDSASFLSEVYFKHEWPENPGPDIAEKLERGLHELRRLCRARLRKFDHIFYVPAGQFSPGDDPTRLYVESQQHLGQKIKAYLDDNNAPYHTVTSVGLEERVDEVSEILRRVGAL